LLAYAVKIIMDEHFSKLFEIPLLIISLKKKQQQQQEIQVGSHKRPSNGDFLTNAMPFISFTLVLSLMKDFSLEIPLPLISLQLPFTDLSHELQVRAKLADE